MITIDHLHPFLDAALDGDTLLAAEPELFEIISGHAAPASEKQASNRETEDEQHDLMLRVTADILYAIARQDHLSALDSARKLQAYTRDSDPFEGRSFRLAAQLAAQLQDQDAAEYFEGRYQSYQDRRQWISALEALSEALASPYLATDEEPEPAEAGGTESVTSPSEYWLPAVPTPAAFLPFSNTRQEPPTRTYIVLVRKLTDPTTAAFAVFPATLADLTDGGAYGRENRHGELYADLLLEFGSEALSLLGSLDLDALSIRFVFKASREFETFSIQDNTLFGLETAIDECRLYFKLKVPPAWLAAELPLHLIWANIESCVLLSVAD